MSINHINDVSFDDAATSVMGEVFDQICRSLQIIRSQAAVREVIATRIINAAANGERNPARLCGQVLMVFGIERMSMLPVSVGRHAPTQLTL